MLRSALRRLAIGVTLAAGATALGSFAIGALAGSSAARSVSLGFYFVGSFLLVGGFFVGNRGPLRLKGTDAMLPFWGSRAVRWATEAEREEAINTSAVYVGVGFALVLLGVLVDDRVTLL